MSEGLAGNTTTGTGSLIWLRQTRPYIGFDITKLATDAVAACLDPTQARPAINLYYKTVRFVNAYPRKITYSPPPARTASLMENNILPPHRRLILFTDAGFGSLAGSHSVDGTVAILATVTGRDGIVRCRGYLLDRRCAKYNESASHHWPPKRTRH